MNQYHGKLEDGGNSRSVRFLILETSIPATVMTGLHPEEMVVWLSIKSVWVQSNSRLSPQWDLCQQAKQWSEMKAQSSHIVSGWWCFRKQTPYFLFIIHRKQPPETAGECGQAEHVTAACKKHTGRGGVNFLLTWAWLLGEVGHPHRATALL